MGHLMLDRLHFFLLGAHRSQGSARDAVFLAVHKLNNGSRSELQLSLAGKLSRTSINRALHFLLEVGAIREIPGGRYEITEPLATKPHHHFLACTNCGHRIPFSNHSLEAQMVKVAIKNQFELESHQLELAGRCYLCKEE